MSFMLLRMMMVMMTMMVMMIMMMLMMKTIKMTHSVYVTILVWISHFVAFGHVAGEKITKGFL